MTPTIASDAPPASKQQQQQQQPPSPRLGEELPIFCERCGYSLHGLPTLRCGHCDILHFHCPECGHRQPINTLRPAVQRILGRSRAFVLAIVVLLKLFIFFWLLFAWVGMGVEWSYRWDYQRTAAGQVTARSFEIRPVDLEQIVAFLLLGLGYGMFARMMLLRWRRGYLVGVWLAGLMLPALCLGIAIQRGDRDITIAWPWTDPAFAMLMAMTALIIIFGASVVWWIWSGLVRVFLPMKVAAAVLEWQSFRPAKSTCLARE